MSRARKLNRTCHTSVLNSRGWTAQTCLSCKNDVGGKIRSTIFILSDGFIKSEIFDKINVLGGSTSQQFVGNPDGEINICKEGVGISFDHRGKYDQGNKGGCRK